MLSDLLFLICPLLFISSSPAFRKHTLVFLAEHPALFHRKAYPEGSDVLSAPLPAVPPGTHQRAEGVTFVWSVGCVHMHFLHIKIISLLALRCATFLLTYLQLFYFRWSPFNLGFPPVTFGPEDRRCVTTCHLWDGIFALMGDEPSSKIQNWWRVCLDLSVISQTLLFLYLKLFWVYFLIMYHSIIVVS